LDQQENFAEWVLVMSSDAFRCFIVDKDESGEVQREIGRRTVADLPAGAVRIRVQFSSVNFKDALAASGHPGLVRSFPHVPGIDVAGEVVESTDAVWSPGDQVIVTGRDLGVGRWGGWAEQIRVPSDWVLPLPEGMTPVEAMSLGTAGFTAAQCVSALREHNITPDVGDVLVTGATGGVGSLAVRLLSKLGYRVFAATGKPDQHERLQQWGASGVLTRDEVNDTSSRPLLKAKWAGSVDTVGGNILATTLRSMSHRGCVAACGLTAGHDLPLTVYPFLLRGVTLAGIDSAECPLEPRKEIWRKLSGEWKLPGLAKESTVIGFGDLNATVDAMLSGKLVGRYVVQVSDS
jgi:putative YhdH/YhfP family quinone oxidoreductase